MLRKLLIIVTMVALGTVSLRIVWEFSGAARQPRGIALAESLLQDHADFARALETDPRFGLVSAFVSTENDGGIVIRGAVATNEDLRQLKQRWGDPDSPVKTLFQVTIIGETRFAEELKHRPSPDGMANGPKS